MPHLARTLVWVQPIHSQCPKLCTADKGEDGLHRGSGPTGDGHIFELTHRSVCAANRASIRATASFCMEGRTCEQVSA